MSQKNPAGRPRKEAKRADPREPLLTVAIDIFGRYGYEGATTRALADAAGVNLQAIPYYFGGKQGLYLAAAEHIGTLIASHIAELRQQARDRLVAAEQEGATLEAEEAQALLTRIVETIAGVFVSNESEPWARFLIREQMEPTEAFQRIFGSVMGPTLMVAGKLVGIILGEDPDSEHVKLRTVSLLGSVMVFRVAHAAVLAHLAWPEIGRREAEKVRQLAAELVTALARSGGGHEA